VARRRPNGRRIEPPAQREENRGRAAGHQHRLGDDERDVDGAQRSQHVVAPQQGLEDDRGHRGDEDRWKKAAGNGGDDLARAHVRTSGI
jgi:hypothetical protein